MSTHETKPPTIFTERPRPSEYVAPVIVLATGIGALVVGAFMRHDNETDSQYAGFALQTVGVVAEYAAGSRLLEKMQCNFWDQVANAGMDTAWVDYRMLGAQFIHESRLDEEALDPLATRVYVIPAPVVQEAQV